MKYPSNVSPIGSPGPFGVIEMGGMFTIFKVRDNLTSYADPGWYQHPPGTVAEAVDMNDMQHNMSHNMNNKDQHDMNGIQHIKTQQGQTDHSMQNSPHNRNTVSWFCQEEDKKESHKQEGNWMQSKPEDSMGGHMMHGMGGMPHNMQDLSQEKKKNSPGWYQNPPGTQAVEVGARAPIEKKQHMHH